MLETVIKGLRAFEKYAIRLPDEFIHRQISRPVEWVERKYGFSRNKQALALNCISSVVVQFVGFIVPGIKHDYQLARDTASLIGTAKEIGFSEMLSTEINPYLSRGFQRWIDVVNFKLKYMALYASVGLDGMQLLNKGDSSQNNGAIAADSEVNSHTSFIGVIRPYLFGGSISAIAYGLLDGNQTSTNYGFSALPWALSMYVRDDQSGGLLQRVLDRWRNRSPATLVPQPQTVQTSNPIAT